MLPHVLTCMDHTDGMECRQVLDRLDNAPLSALQREWDLCVAAIDF